MQLAFFFSKPLNLCVANYHQKGFLWLEMLFIGLFIYFKNVLNFKSMFLIEKHFLSFLSLIHSIATRVIKLAHAKSSVALAPALVETYSRLLVYMEIESLGIKGFISKKENLFFPPFFLLSSIFF